MDENADERTPLKGRRHKEEELTGCGATVFCDPHRALHRYLVLIIMCFLSFGSYFCYDNPAALQDTMKADLNIGTSTFMTFYSFYSWPNVILCFFGGFLLDRVFGIRLGTIIFSVFVLVGQLIFALGAILNKIWVMDLGRFVFGMGGESLAVAQNTYAVNWFKGRELNMVFGLQISFSRVGSTVNMNVMQPIYKYVNQFYEGYVCLGIVLYIAAATCILSLLCSLAMAYFDWRANRILKTDQQGTGEVIRLSDVKDFPLIFWILCIVCVAYYVAVFPFIGLGLVFYEMKYDMSPSDANAVNSVVYIISAVASPIFGFCIDKTGRNVLWVLVGILVTLGSHALLAFTFLNPYVPVVIMGLALSVVASALWPMVALMVPEHQLGTAYGICVVRWCRSVSSRLGQGRSRQHVRRGQAPHGRRTGLRDAAGPPADGSRRLGAGGRRLGQRDLSAPAPALRLQHQKQIPLQDRRPASSPPRYLQTLGPGPPRHSQVKTSCWKAQSGTIVHLRPVPIELFSIFNLRMRWKYSRNQCSKPCPLISKPCPLISKPCPLILSLI